MPLKRRDSNTVIGPVGVPDFSGIGEAGLIGRAAVLQTADTINKFAEESLTQQRLAEAERDAAKTRLIRDPETGMPIMPEKGETFSIYGDAYRKAVVNKYIIDADQQTRKKLQEYATETPFDPAAFSAKGGAYLRQVIDDVHPSAQAAIVERGGDFLNQLRGGIQERRVRLIIADTAKAEARIANQLAAEVEDTPAGTPAGKKAIEAYRAMLSAMSQMQYQPGEVAERVRAAVLKQHIMTNSRIMANMSHVEMLEAVQVLQTGKKSPFVLPENMTKKERKQLISDLNAIAATHGAEKTARTHIAQEEVTKRNLLLLIKAMNPKAKDIYTGLDLKDIDNITSPMLLQTAQFVQAIVNNQEIDDVSREVAIQQAHTLNLIAKARGLNPVVNIDDLTKKSTRRVLGEVEAAQHQLAAQQIVRAEDEKKFQLNEQLNTANAMIDVANKIAIAFGIPKEEVVRDGGNLFKAVSTATSRLAILKAKIAANQLLTNKEQKEAKEESRNLVAAVGMAYIGVRFKKIMIEAGLDGDAVFEEMNKWLGEDFQALPASDRMAQYAIIMQTTMVDAVRKRAKDRKLDSQKEVGRLLVKMNEHLPEIAKMREELMALYKADRLDLGAVNKILRLEISKQQSEFRAAQREAARINPMLASFDSTTGVAFNQSSANANVADAALQKRWELEHYAREGAQKSKPGPYPAFTVWANNLITKIGVIPTSYITMMRTGITSRSKGALMDAARIFYELQKNNRTKSALKGAFTQDVYDKLEYVANHPTGDVADDVLDNFDIRPRGLDMFHPEKTDYAKRTEMTELLTDTMNNRDLFKRIFFWNDIEIDIDGQNITKLDSDLKWQRLRQAAISPVFLSAVKDYFMRYAQVTQRGNTDQLKEAMEYAVTAIAKSGDWGWSRFSTKVMGVEATWWGAKIDSIGFVQNPPEKHYADANGKADYLSVEVPAIVNKRIQRTLEQGNKNEVYGPGDIRLMPTGKTNSAGRPIYKAMGIKFGAGLVGDKTQQVQGTLVLLLEPNSDGTGLQPIEIDLEAALIAQNATIAADKADAVKLEVLRTAEHRGSNKLTEKKDSIRQAFIDARQPYSKQTDFRWRSRSSRLLPNPSMIRSDSADPNKVTIQIPKVTDGHGSAEDGNSE